MQNLFNVKVMITDPRLGGYISKDNNVNDAQFPAPQYESEGAAGIDLRAMIDTDTITIEGGQQAMIPTGIRVDMTNTNLMCVAMPRSGAGCKRKIVLGNLVGLIDNDYQGQIFLCAWNRGKDPVTIECGERIAQLVFLPCIQVGLDFVSSFETVTERGSKGFGASGRI